MNSIMRDWAANLGLRHQGVLVSAVRGCDGAHREDPSKYLVRVYRGVLLRAHCGELSKASSFMCAFSPEDWEDSAADFYESIDHYPNHWLLHWMHACEIVGYKYWSVDQVVCNYFRSMYLRLVRKFHLSPETEEEMDKRLSVDEKTFASQQV